MYILLPPKIWKAPSKIQATGQNVSPKKFKSALKKLCDRAKGALNSHARISSPEEYLIVQAIYDKYVPNLEQIATKMK